MASGQENICEICSEDVLGRGRKFGLLESCEHRFCLDCIREWRNQKEKQDRVNLRRCPVCRVESYLIIPSPEFIADRDRKIAEKNKYSSHVSQIPCRNFNFGRGTCQFGSSCLYLHSASEGGSVQAAASDFRVVKGADGKKKGVTMRLSEFLVK